MWRPAPPRRAAGPATGAAALQARLLADFRSSVQLGPCLEGFGRCQRDMRGRRVVVGGAASFPIGRRSASAEAAKCALASGCAEARAMIDALLTCGEVDNPCSRAVASTGSRSEEHTSELQSRLHLVCRLLLEKKNDQGHGESLGERDGRVEG